MDYYNILGVSKTSTSDDIKKAYKQLSLKYHPDRPNGNEQKFKEISAAYNVLGDPHKKQQYDQCGVNIPNKFNDSMAHNIFKSFFGNRDPFQNVFDEFEIPETSGQFYSVQTTTIRHPDGRVETQTQRSTNRRPQSSRQRINF